MGVDELPIPVEIPWKLAATTRMPAQSNPSYADSTLSVFTYEPDLPEIERHYAGSRLVYLRFALSLQPRQRVTALIDAAGYPPEEWEFLDRRTACPLRRVVLDVHIRSLDGKSYFIAAAPVRREMVVDAERGTQRLEGTSESLAVGKSASTLHESFASTTETSGLGLTVDLPVGISAQSTSTTVTGTRDAAQSVDVMQREASTERRELQSHTTRVSNILSLLNVYHVGSSQLRWRLSPPPITGIPFPLDDLYAWYAELLRQRSSGLEGLQDLYAIAVVPQGNWCVDATLHEIGVLQPVSDPEPPLLSASMAERPGLKNLAIEYCSRRYPRGTSVDELDLDILGTAELQQSPPGKAPVGADLDRARAVTVVGWEVIDVDPADPHGAWVMCTLRGLLGRAVDDADDPAKFPLLDGWADYKPLSAVVLEALRDEIRRRALLGMEDSALLVRSSSLTWCTGSLVSPTVSQTIGVIDAADLGQSSRAAPRPRKGGGRAAAESAAAVAASAATEQALSQRTASLRPGDLHPFALEHPDVQRVILTALARLDRSDPANRRLGTQPLLGISVDAQSRLRDAGVLDLATLASELVGVQEAATLNAGLEETRKLISRRPGTAGANVVGVERRLTADAVGAARREVAAGLGRLRRSG